MTTLTTLRLSILALALLSLTAWASATPCGRIILALLITGGGSH